MAGIKGVLFSIVILLLLSCSNNNNNKPGFGGTDTTSDSTNNVNPTTAGDDSGSGPGQPIPNEACTSIPARANLPVTLRSQAATFWCWAASGQMVMESLGTFVTQCDEANKQEFTRQDCCSSPMPGECDDAGWPQFEKYGFLKDRTTNEALSWDQVKNQIGCRKIPFCATWHWSGGGGHMMIVSGYKIQNGDTLVKMIDPWPPGSLQWKSYAEYVSGSDHTHWNDFYNVRKTAVH